MHNSGTFRQMYLLKIHQKYRRRKFKKGQEASVRRGEAENSPGEGKKTPSTYNRRNPEKEKHHPLSAEAAHTRSDKSSPIDLTGRENLRSILGLLSAAVRRDHHSRGESIKVRNQISFNFTRSTSLSRNSFFFFPSVESGL